MRKFKTNRKALLILLAAVILTSVTLSVILASDAGTESREMTGTLSIDKDRFILNSGKEKMVICSLPPAARDSLGFHPAEGDTLSVKGYVSKYALVVKQATWKGKSYAFRDSLMQFTRPEQGNWNVNHSTCIGCGLCANFCPGGAITMQKTDKGNKAVIDQSLCLGCNICVAGNGNRFNGCPTKAITK
jgi:ferredoxin